MSLSVSIGDAARATGVKVPTIRYYEEVGLLPVPARTEGNRRLYSDKHLKRLMFIRHARELGFEVEAIRALLSLQDKPETSCSMADSIAQIRLKEVNERIAKLNALKAELERMIAGCSHGTVADCRVIEVLADHAHCASPAH